jgi:hypothetical protein
VAFDRPPPDSALAKLDGEPHADRAAAEMMTSKSVLHHGACPSK